METALVHDYLLVLRGAERTFAAIADCWPGAPIHTLLYDEAGTSRRFAGREVIVSPLQRLGVGQSSFQRLLPLYPHAAERLPVAGHDLVVSSSSAFAHGVRPGPDAVHVCYCHSPFRYAWFERERAIAETAPVLRPAVRGALSRIRRWDRTAAGRVTQYIANSETTRRRIGELYGRDATVLHPPVDVDRFAGDASPPDDFVLVVTELVGHKRVDVALGAARVAGKRIKVVGTGRELSRLKALHGDHAEFLGRVDDQTLAALYARALAVIVPGEEEFGITAVEAQAAGRPVVALARGGARETVKHDETGILVEDRGIESFADVLRSVDFERFSPDALRAHARKFSRVAFQRSLQRIVARACAKVLT